MSARYLEDIKVKVQISYIWVSNFNKFFFGKFGKVVRFYKEYSLIATKVQWETEAHL